LNFKEIKLLCNNTSQTLSVSFKVKTESGKDFSINERSKGCKWFFSFLIFTEFRKQRTDNILFLLDEPASNLHSSAQIKILDAIQELSDKSMVVYSTHSHHLINPKWLKGAYVVVNEGISNEQLSGALTDNDAKIHSEKYFNYVAKNEQKNNTLFFQPILDRLDYKPSYIEPVPNIVICEGKYDWYTFLYFKEIIFKGNYNLNFYPGNGRDTHYDIIRLYLSWGSNFILILDGDKPGQKSKEDYEKEFGTFVDKKIFTYFDILNEESSTEDLFTETDIELFSESAFGVGTSKGLSKSKQTVKSKFNFSILQLLNSKKEIDIHDATKQKFKTIFEFIIRKQNQL